MNSVCTLTIGAMLLLPLGTAAAPQDKVERGKTVFTEQKCTLCHSIAGKGKKTGPLDEVGSKLSAAEIRQWITDPVGMAAKTQSKKKPPMKKKALSPDDVDALVALISSLKKS